MDSVRLQHAQVSKGKPLLALMHRWVPGCGCCCPGCPCSPCHCPCCCRCCCRCCSPCSCPSSHCWCCPLTAAAVPLFPLQPSCCSNHSHSCWGCRCRMVRPSWTVFVAINRKRSVVAAREGGEKWRLIYCFSAGDRVHAAWGFEANYIGTRGGGPGRTYIQPDVPTQPQN